MTTQFIKQYVKLLIQKRFDKKKFGKYVESCSIDVNYSKLTNIIEIDVVTSFDKVVNNSIDNDPTEDETVNSEPIQFEANIDLKEVTELNYIDFSLVECIIYELADDIIQGQRDFENE